MYFIYSIYCCASRKMYIGSTINFRRRAIEHRCRLNAGTHPNRHLQNAWRKYGQRAFVFSVIEAVEARADLAPAEDWACRRAKARGVKIYNRREVASSNTNHRHTKETKDKIRAALKGRNTRTPEGIERAAAKLRGQKKPMHVVVASAAARAKMWAERGDEMRWKCRRLTAEQVHKVREMIAAGASTYAEIGGQFGVSAATICLIHKGRRYSGI